MLARVNKILRTLLKNQAKAEIEMIYLIFVPLVESLPSLSRTKKASANKAPIVIKLERVAENLLAVTSAEIISLDKSFLHKEIGELEQRRQEQVNRSQMRLCPNCFLQPSQEYFQLESAVVLLFHLAQKM